MDKPRWNARRQCERASPVHWFWRLQRLVWSDAKYIQSIVRSKWHFVASGWVESRFNFIYSRESLTEIKLSISKSTQFIWLEKKCKWKVLKENILFPDDLQRQEIKRKYIKNKKNYFFRVILILFFDFVFFFLCSFVFLISFCLFVFHFHSNS